MDDAMVTARMSVEKKAAGNKVLEKAGLNASQFINKAYDRLIEDQDAKFVGGGTATLADWERAAKLVDSIPFEKPLVTRFDDMTKGEIAYERYKTRCEQKGIPYE